MQAFVLMFIIVILVIIIKCICFGREEYFVRPTFETSRLLKMVSDALFDILDHNQTVFAPPLESLNDRDVFNEFTLEEGTRSFTENKKRIVLCVRKSSTSLYTWNSVMFVALHEVSHVICDELHHTRKFHDINKALLLHAERLGFYDSSIAFESKYCGL